MESRQSSYQARFKKDKGKEREYELEKYNASSFKVFPNEILENIILYLNENDKNNLSLIEKYTNEFFKFRTAKNDVLLELYNYYTKRNQHYNYRNYVYLDKERLTKIDKLKRDLSSLFLNEPSCNAELGYIRKIDYSSYYNLTARTTAQAISLRNFNLFPFNFDISKYINTGEEINISIYYSISKLTEFINRDNNFEFIPTSKTNEAIPALIFRISNELNSISLSSKNYRQALIKMMRILLNQLPLQDKITYLSSINNALIDSESMKSDLKRPDNWNKCCVWQYPAYRVMSIEGNSFLAWWRVRDHYRPSYSYRTGTELMGHRSTTERKEIPGTGTDLEYFFPNRDMYEEFSNIQQSYGIIKDNLLSVIMLEDLNNKFLISSPEWINQIECFEITDILKMVNKDDIQSISILRLCRLFISLYDYTSNSDRNHNIEEMGQFKKLLNNLQIGLTPEILKQFFDRKINKLYHKFLTNYADKHCIEYIVNAQLNADLFHIECAYQLFQVILHFKSEREYVAKDLCDHLNINSETVSNFVNTTFDQSYSSSRKIELATPKYATFFAIGIFQRLFNNENFANKCNPPCNTTNYKS